MCRLVSEVSVSRVATGVDVATIEVQKSGSDRSQSRFSLGSMRSTFANLAPRLNTLVTRWKRGVYRVSQRAESSPIQDSRGAVVRRIENLQTFLTASEVDRLVGDYLTGATVAQLAERYGVHRATVSAHLTRRGVVRRQPGVGVEEAAEAVRLNLGGVSMRAIAQSMGVDRKAVRRAGRGFRDQCLRSRRPVGTRP